MVYTSNLNSKLLSISFLLIFQVLAYSVVYAQSPIEMELSSMSEGSFMAFTTSVEGASEKLAASEWSDLMKEYGGRAKKSKPERYKVEEVTINSIGGNDPLAVFADFNERGSQVKVYVWIRYRGDFLNADASKRDLEASEALVKEFALRLRRAAIEEEIDYEENEFDKIDKKLKNLERDLEGYERDIERAKEAIIRAEANIEKNKAAQEETRSELARQADAVKAVQEKLSNVKG